jgi:hypothetical protein
MTVGWRRPSPQDEGRPPLPNFLIIGAQKSGTRWLRSNLGEHPEILAVDEELWFFNDARKQYSTKGVDWYREQFAAWRDEPFLGEASPGYMMLRHDPSVVAGRIHEVIPDVRLFAVLRNPIDRAYSAMVHHTVNGRIPQRSNLLDLVRSPSKNDAVQSLVDGGLYAASLTPYVERFGDQLTVFLHDDVNNEPQRVYAAAVAHLGADPGFVPPGLGEVRFSNQQTRLTSPRTWKRSRFWPTAKPPAKLRPADRVALYEYFRDDVDALERLLDIDLSRWDPDVHRASGRASG